MPITPRTIANRLNMDCLVPMRVIIRAPSGRFQATLVFQTTLADGMSAARLRQASADSAMIGI
jgi:hypothetical protein